MGTNSSITICKNGSDGIICKGVYCHWDGYLSHNGRILLENYNTEDAVEALIAYGDMSILAETLIPTNGTEHSFDNPQDGVCVFYHRDRGEPWERVKPIEDIEDKVENYYKGNKQEYNYMFDNGKWYWNTHGSQYWEGGMTWKLLTKEDIELDRS